MTNESELKKINSILKSLIDGKKPSIGNCRQEIYENLRVLSKKLEQDRLNFKKIINVNEKFIREALTESKERISTIFESSRDGIMLINNYYEVIDINNRLSELTGYDEKRLVSKLAYKLGFFLSKDSKEIKSDFDKIFEGKKHIVKEYSITSKSGKEIFIEMHSSSIKKNNEASAIISIIRDITENKNAQIALKKSEEKFRNQFLYYKELDDIKNDFINFLSHELKSPLVPIISYSDLFLKKILGPISAGQKKAMISIKESAQELLGMIEEILDISRIERGTMKFNYSDFSINELVLEVINSEKGFASGKGLKIIFKKIPEKLIINCDRVKLARVIHNLVNNAIKFTEKGSITISIEKKKNDLIIIVKDSGIGIPDEKKDKIFTKFFQIDSSLSRKYSGTGVGLYNAKVVVEGMNGEISFKSEKNKGTSFTIKLPVKPINQPKTIAIIGASPNKARMSNKAVRAYLKKGFKVFPINPKYEEVEGLKAYSSIHSLTIKPEIISVYTNPEITKTLIDDIASVSPKKVFFNPGSTNKEALIKIDKTKLNYERLCSIMAIGENPENY